MTNNPWVDWYEQQQAKRDEALAKQAEALLEEEKKSKDSPLEWSDKFIRDYRPMLDGLKGVTFRPASYEKRFTRSMQDLPDGQKLTVKQCRLIENLYHRYRKQIHQHEKHCAICGGKKA